MDTVSSQTFSSRVNPILVVSGLILVIMVGWFTYAFSSRMVLQNHIDSLQKEKTDHTAQIGSFESANVRQILQSKEFLASLQARIIPWSTALRDLFLITPKNPVSGVAKVSYLSFSGGLNGSMNVSVTTAEDSADAFADVAELLQSFSAASHFENPFIPSVSRGLTEKGNTLLSFVLNLTYHE